MQRTPPPGLPARPAVVLVATCADRGGSTSPGTSGPSAPAAGPVRRTDDLGPAC